MTFFEKLAIATRRHQSLLCVGLDPDPQRIPQGMGVLEFNRAIIEATQDLVCAYKPNLAFYEALGVNGWRILRETVEAVPYYIPVIGDAKRGDIGNTAQAYARALFEELGFDAVTVNPYLGGDSVEPFLAYEDRCIFLLCRTSNPGGADFQSLLNAEGVPLYETVARKALEWNTRGNLGLVVGATAPEELRRIRELCPQMPLLIPGVGAQGGDLEAAVGYGQDAQGAGIIINSSRQILYASSGNDFAEAARAAASALRDAINTHRRTLT